LHTKILGALEVFFDPKGLTCSLAPKKAVLGQVEYAFVEYAKTLIPLADIQQTALRRDWLILGVALHVLMEYDPQDGTRFQELLNIIVEYINYLRQYDFQKGRISSISSGLLDKIQGITSIK
jgi:hypothetical protein